MSKPKIAGVIGPTASGKTAFAIDLALAEKGEIVSCDSMQIYRGMDIGTAKPQKEEMRGVPHHMIDVADINENFSVAKFVKMARAAIDDILSRGKLPILCGGTGLYFDSVVSNINFTAQKSDSEYREYLNRLAAEKGGDYVYEMLREADPKSAEAIHPNNVRRVIRALEIYHATGLPKSELDIEQRGEPLYDAKIYCLRLPREKLYEKINQRVDMMMAEGLEEEVRGLIERGARTDSTAMQAIGYKEMAAYIRGELSKDEAVEKIKRETRRYAKRQMTWFRGEKNVTWVDMNQKDLFID